MDGKWDDKEVKTLFDEVENVKAKNRSIKAAFLLHATRFSRKPNSVRNYYYQELTNLENDKERSKRLGIDLLKHQRQEIKFFTEKEGEKIVAEINKLIEKGYSVRQACLRLSGGDVALMLRYQNKFRNSQQKSPSSCQEPVNILEFKNRQKTLTDSDLNSLFVGLSRLVKKLAMEEASMKSRQEKESLNLLLKKTLGNLEEKEREIKQLKEMLEKARQENLRLKTQNTKNTLDKAKLLSEKLINMRLRTNLQSQIDL